MDNAYLTYNFGRVIKDKANLKINLNIQNVFELTKYDGWILR
jgi:iron complex outermembrane receptor protein